MREPFGGVSGSVGRGCWVGYASPLACMTVHARPPALHTLPFLSGPAASMGERLEAAGGGRRNRPIAARLDEPPPPPRRASPPCSTMVVAGETTLANRSAKSDDVRKGNIIAAKGEWVWGECGEWGLP